MRATRGLEGSISNVESVSRTTLEPRLRIGFDARWYNDSGVGTYTLELLRAMSQIQAGFELVAYESPANPVPLEENSRLKKVALSSGRYSLSEQVELSSRCRRDRLDIFHSPFYIVPLAASCPVVVTVHDLIPFLFRIASRPKQFLVKTGYRMAAAKAAQIITVSSQTACDLKKLLHVPENKITPIANAVRREVFHPEGAAEELESLGVRFGVQPPYVVVASARNWRTKNLVTALKALDAARARSASSFQTVLYGPEEGLNAAGGQGRWNTLNLRITGYVQDKYLAALFRHARAFVFPSLYEGFGLPILEAMSCGCPVITSNGGSLAEVAGNGAQVFEPFDVESMSAALLRLLAIPEEYQQWRLSGLARAAEFSWERAARETLAVYYRTYNQAYGS
jgi:glycosyltransferase involved in cell wall biosynthesis